MSPPHGGPKEGSLPLGGTARSAKGAHYSPPHGGPKEGSLPLRPKARSAKGALRTSSPPLRRGKLVVASLVMWNVAGTVGAEEGVWTFDRPPLAILQAAHGFVPQPQWLDALRLSALKLGGGSGSFISADGLVLTNHHVAMSCLQKLSTETNDLVRDGFLAKSRVAERACPEVEIKRLESTEDVTARIRSAIKSADNESMAAERNIAIAVLEKECTAGTGLRCEVVTLYRGAAYHLYRYRAWTDVRLVFAPEARIGFFGGDADNFTYPRFDLDFALLRVYERQEAVKPVHYLKWSHHGVAEGDLVFAAGHPGSTDRLLTVAQLEFDRDARYPLMIASAKRARDVLQRFSAQSAEARRRATSNLFGTENWLKAMLGGYKALKDPALIAKKKVDEALLRQSSRSSPGRDDPWQRIAMATAKESRALKESWVVDYGYATLFATAGKIVELVNERTLPDGERLPEYRDSAIPRLLLRLTADAPVYKDLEIARTTGYWQEALDLLGADHTFVKGVLDGDSPLRAASKVVESTRIDQLQVRKKLIDGDIAALEASNDPLIVLARAIYPMRRRLEKSREIEVETPIRQAADELAQARFSVLGTNTYPDATGSLRLSFGTVRGYDADGRLMPWHTNFWGLYARSAAFGAKPPFALTDRWMDRQPDLALSTPLNFVSTLDIIGGSSGSPVINRAGELVGLIFDGNLEGLGGRFVYTDDKARAIAVDARAMVEALDKIYGAHELAVEMVGN